MANKYKKISDSDGIKISRVNKNLVSDNLVFSLVESYKRFNVLKRIETMTQTETDEYIILQDRIKFISCVLVE